MIAPELASLAVPVDSLTQLPGNPRRGDEESVRRSYVAFGQQKPIVVQHRGAEIVVIDGNTQHRVAAGLGWPAIAVSEFAIEDPPGSGQFRAGTIAEADAYALAVNRTADLGTYDDGALVTLLQSLDDDLRNVTSYSDDDLSVLLRSVGAAEKAGLTDPDDVPESAPARTKPGDLWLLGPHRVLCGDSTVPADVERLMGGAKASILWTDPPYGVDYVGKTKRALTIENDDAFGLPGLLRGFMAAAAPALEPSSPFYIAAPAGPLYVVFLQAIAESDWRYHQELVWRKDTMVLGHSDYHYAHEPLLYGYLPGPGRPGRGAHDGTRWFGDHSQVSVIDCPRPKRSEEHPTMKPVALIERCLHNSSRPGSSVLDLFGGSGSTLIACEQTGRVAYLCEIDPRYADVICKRFQDFTGVKPVLESTGEPHDFTKE
jgi:DNA modification methylase